MTRDCLNNASVTSDTLNSGILCRDGGTPSNGIRPVLAQYAASGSLAKPLPEDCFVDPDDSMLRASGSSTPLVETLLADEPYCTASTLMTEDGNDPIDPDTVRVGGDRLVTFITRAEDEPNDPDVIRLDARRAFDTMLTKSDVDPGDPDTVR